MIFKRLILLTALLLLFVLTSVGTGVLEPRRQTSQADDRTLFLPPPLCSATAEDVKVSIATNPAQRPIFQRLNDRLRHNPDDFEAGLLRGLLLFQNGDLPGAIKELQNLVAKAPNFNLAHLILGDLFSARFNQLDHMGNCTVSEKLTGVDSKRLEQLQLEARARLNGYLSLVDEVNIPSSLVTLGTTTRYALVVDKSKNRLYVYRNQGPGLPPLLMDDFYIVLGRQRGDKTAEGDLKTPNGVYFVTQYVSDEELPPLYGSGAFPFNYPNEVDRRLRKTGQGIWLHGTHKALYSRPPLDSEGCVVLTNEEFVRIKDYVDVGRTPVIISEQISWISSRQWLTRTIELQAVLETWRQYWEKADLEAYLGMYARDFWTGGYDSLSWGDYKEKVFSTKTFQKIEFSDISLFAYPQPLLQRPLVVANFTQRYRSNNYNGDMRKRLYLVKEKSQWKIVYEGTQ